MKIQIKKKFLFKHILVFCLCLPILPLFAQIKFTAGVNRNKVGVGEQFQISFSISANGANFKAPSFSEFNVLAGPSTSTNMSIVNGSFSQSVSYTYYLAAKREGNFTIGAASIIVDNKKIESNPVTIEVVKGASQAQGGGNRPNQQNQGAGGNAATSKEIGDNIFLRASIDKSKLFVGEQVVVTYKLYRRVDIMQYQVNEMPKYNGFWKEDLKTSNETYTESVDGIQYAVTEIKKVLLFPQRAGKLAVDPLDITCLVRIKSRRQSNNIFDDFFGMGGYQDVRQQFTCKPVKMEVEPLPANKPADFSGSVGKFSLIGKPDKTKLKANDAVNFKLVVSGKGNLKLVEPPKIDLPEEVEAYEPKTIDNITVAASGISGSRTFEYLIIPRSGGTFVIPAVKFSYFDTEKNMFQTLNTEPVTLNVEGPKGQVISANGGAVISRKQEVKISDNDIRYIKNETELSVKHPLFYRTTFFWLFLFIPVGAFAAFVLLKDKLIKVKSDSEIKMQRAAKIAFGQLDKSISPAAGSTEAIVYDILSEYLMDKLNLSQSQLDKEELEKVFARKKVVNSLSSSVIGLLNELEMSKYSPVGIAGRNGFLKDKTKELIKQMEEAI